MRVLGLGDNTIDTYVDLGLQFPGGNAVNVAVLARRNGAEAGYLGCIGDDPAGDLLVSALLAEGVDMARCRRRNGPNARALIAQRDGDRRFIGSTRGVRGDYLWEPEDFAYVTGFAVVHTSIYSELDDVLPRIRHAAALLSYDFSERWNAEVLARTLPFIDIAFLSCPGRTDDECADLLKECAGDGPRIVVATRGKAGAMAIGGGVVHAQGVTPARVVDTLGAGDGFITAFLVARLKGIGIAEALAAGADLAAGVCGYQGAFGRGTAWVSTDSPATARAV